MTASPYATVTTEADRFGGFVRRVVRAYARRVGDRDIEALAGLAQLSKELDAAMVEAVRNLHGNPYSWTDIGAVLGISRQAAQMRFAEKIRSSPRLVPEGPPPAEEDQ